MSGERFAWTARRPPRAAARACVVVVAAILSGAAQGVATAQTLPDGVSSLPWVVDGGAVESTARIGDTLYVGGAFRAVAPRSGLLGAAGVFHARTGQFLTADPTLVGSETAAAVSDGRGGWYLGGRFAGSLLVHLDRAGRRAPGPVVTGGFAKVLALARAGSVLYLGGTFSSVNGQPRAMLAAIDIATDTLLPWNPGVANGIVQSLYVEGQSVYVGGMFTAIGGVSRTGLARVDAASGAIDAWAPALSAAGTGADVTVQAIVGFGPSIVVGGWFNSVNGVARSHVAALDRQSGVPTAFAPNPTARVLALAASSTRLYVGGLFVGVTGAPFQSGAAAYDLNGALTSWRPPLSGNADVRALAVTSDGVVIGGEFDDNSARRHLIKVDALGGAVAGGWNPSPGGIVLALATAGDEIAIGGLFSTFRATPLRGVVGLDLNGGPPVHLPRPLGTVRALAALGTTLYMGGFGSFSAAHLSAYDTSTGTMLPFSPTIAGVNPVVHRLVAHGTTVFVAASSGPSGMSLEAVDAVSGARLPFTPAAFSGGSPSIRAMVVAGGKLWVAGQFTAARGVPRNGLAAFDPVTGALDALDLAPDRQPDTLSVDGGFLYVGGSFSTIGGQARPRAARLDPSSGAIDPWQPTGLGVNTIYAGAGLVLASGVLTSGFSGLIAVDAVSGAVTAPIDGLLGAPTIYADGVAAVNALTGQALFHRRRSGAGLPEQVRDLSAHVQGQMLTLQWTPSPAGAVPTAYRILAGSVPGGADIGALVVGPTPVLSGVVPPGRYFVRIVPLANGVEGPASADVGFVAGEVGCNVVPLPPTARVFPGLPPTVTWVPGADAGMLTAFELRGGTAPGVLPYALSFPANQYSFSMAGVPPGVYYLAVAAKNACATGPLSNEVQVILDPPPGPSQLQAQVTGSRVTLSWVPSNGFTSSYVIEAGSAPGRSDLAAGVRTVATVFAADGVPPGRYYVRVRALLGTLLSAPSNEVVVVVP